MSKRNNEGDVVTNRVNVWLAGEQSKLSTLLGSKDEAKSEMKRSNEAEIDEELEDEYVDDEAFGLGANIPKDVENGSFTRRLPGSDDKLLQQLIGKKKAQAHLEAQKASSRSSLKQQRYSKPTPAPKEESEDEEEGRASAFKSKKRKTQRSKSKPTISEKAGDVDEELQDVPESELSIRPASKDEDLDEAEKESTAKRHSREDGDDTKESKRPITKSGTQKSKPTSYLDELLAERSKKKKKKKS